MKHKFIFCLLLMSSNLMAQVSVDWYNYPGGVGVATNANYDVYSINWDYNPAGDITLTKRDSAGIILWETAYDNTDNTRHEVSTWVDTDNAGNILVSGTIRSGFSNPVNASSLLMKFDSTGALLWRVIYESSFDGSSTKKLLVDASNNIYVLGLGTGPNGLVTKIKKFDPAGQAVWSYFDSLGLGAPLNMKFTPDSNILIIFRGVVGNVSGFAKIDLSGNTIWSLAGVYSNSIGDAAGDSLGNTYLINGEYVIINSGSVIQKLSPTGSQIWTDTNNITAFRVEVGNDNNPVICGFPNSGTPGAAFIKYDSAGNQLWQNLDADGPSYALLLHAQMRMDQDNAAYLAAGTMTEMAVCKVNSNGTSAWTAVMPGSYASAFDFQTKDVIYVVGGTTAKIGQSSISTFIQDEKNLNVNDVTLFPNPSQNSSTIEFNLSETQNVSISIVDVIGQIVKCIPTINGQVGKNKLLVDLSELNTGIYFCRTETSDRMQIVKLIKN